MKTILVLLFIFSFFTMTNGQTSSTILNLLIGTYTSPGNSDGIYVYGFNTENGEFNFKSEAGGIKNPSYLVVSPDRKHVYAVSEQGSGKGSVSAYAFDAHGGKLTFLNEVSAGGDGPCYISVDKNKKFVFVGNYDGGSLSAIPIKPDGSLGTETQFIQHEGSGIKSNQEKAHVHATVLSADDRFLFVPDLGTDKVNIYNVDLTKASPLTPTSPAYVSVKPGSGPRHFVFHPTNQYAYLIQEMMGIVTLFDYKDGRLTERQSVDMPVQGFTGKIDAADIHISPDAKFLYGSLRGDINEIVIYALDDKGTLTYVGRQATLGRTPRNFVIDPSGKFLLAANQNSDEIIIFKRDQKTGLLSDFGKKITIGKPVCLKFAASK